MAVDTERLLGRARIIDAIRHFFAERDFVEVDTPVALRAPAPELHIQAPAVELWAGEVAQRRYLQPSPELPMKRLLAAGFARIFQIAPVFRDGELGPTHRPEFRLLEWYRRDAGWESLLDDCESLLVATATAAAPAAEANGAVPELHFGGRSICLTRPFRRLTVDEAFRRHAGFSILDALEPAVLRRKLDALAIHHDPQDRWDDLYHRVFLSRVEPALCRDPAPLFLTHFPAPLASLARLCPDDARQAERFELYVGGLELANGFGELTDPDMQRRRFVAEAQLRHRAGLHDYPLDERFLAALSRIRRAAGIALGLERLLMLWLDAADIDGIAWIPWSET